MKKFLQIHVLRSVPANNANRDSVGKPKLVEFGDATRARFSSQSVKAAIRQKFDDNFCGKRSKFFPQVVKDILLTKELNIKENKLDKAIRTVFENLNQKLEKNELKLTTLIFLSNQEVEEIINITEAFIEGKIKEEEIAFTKTMISPDIALFGRMIASSSSKSELESIEAAASFGQTITVNKATIETDFFTAVDDLCSNGSSHLDEFDFTSGVYYSNVVIDTELLLTNLKNEELTNETIKELIQKIISTIPSGKDKSFFANVYPFYILIEKGDEAPRSLANAFAESLPKKGIQKASIEKLEELKTFNQEFLGENLESVFINFFDKDSSVSLEEAIKFSLN